MFQVASSAPRPPRAEAPRLFAADADARRARKSEREREPSTPLRVWFVAFLAVAALGGLGSRIYYLTVLRGAYFYELSENNFLYSRPIGGPRGNILASRGETIAINRTAYNIEMSPYGMSKERIARTVARLAELLGRPDLVKRGEAVAGLRPAWKSLVLASGLDLQAVAPVIERSYELPGVVIEPVYTRLYPYGASAGHVTGYVGPIAKEQLEGALAKGYLRGDEIGKLGVERQYEEVLRGRHGREVYIRDAFGRTRSSWIEEPARRGNDIVLTLDLELQTLADSLLTGKEGVILAMDPRDGAMLAMSSKPDYDPNVPMRGTGSGIASHYNRAIRGAYAPASTFKLVTAAAGLMDGRGTGTGIVCSGPFRLPGGKNPYWCDVRWGHGGLDLYQALQKSCNVYFYTWADQLGYERMVEATRAFGFGSPTGIDLMPEGREPSGVAGKRGDGPVYAGSVVHMGIGQGELIACSPLQLIGAYAALANGGTLWRPHFLREERSPHGEIVGRFRPRAQGTLPLKDWQRDALVEGFRRVVQERGGTAFRKGFDPAWDVAGKTGSAEVAAQRLTNGWFVAFAPVSAPEICVLALVEGEGHGGATAAPLAAEMMRVWFGRKTGSSAEPPIVGEAPPTERPTAAVSG